MIRTKRKRIRLVDIAKVCGVSINTVSHALHDKPDISDALKKKIKKAADDMGYIANSSASLLRLGQSKTISIIVGDISNPHFSIMIKQIEDSARKEGYTAFVINTNENEELEREAIVTSISKNVDGILLCPVQKSKRNIEFLIENRVPFTLFGRYFDDMDTNYVVCDDYHSGKIAADYILSDCRRIAVIMAEPYISSSRERLRGIRAAFVAADRALNEADVYFARASGNNGDILAAVCEKGYDGAVCFSDLLALELLSHKDAIRVVSFDNIMSRFPMPYIFKSITSSKTEMGKKAFEILSDAMNGNTDKQHILLPTALS